MSTVSFNPDMFLADIYTQVLVAERLVVLERRISYWVRCKNRAKTSEEERLASYRLAEYGGELRALSGALALKHCNTLSDPAFYPHRCPPSSLRPRLLIKTGTISLAPRHSFRGTPDMYNPSKVACAESHRLGTKEIRVVQSFEAAVETITLSRAEKANELIYAPGALDNIHHNAPHTRPVQDFLDAQSWPGPPVRRSAEEIARGREALYERLRAKELQRQAEGPKPPPGSPPRPADYYEKRHEERKKRIALKKARRDALQKLRDNPLKGPKLPPPLPTPTLGELKRRATAERDRRERMHSILRDILSLLDPLSLAAVVCVSQHYATLGRVLLFRLINVHHSKAGKLFSTIAKNPAFGEWVHHLYLRGRDPSRRLHGPDFEATAGALVNLRTLHIECNIDVPRFAASDFNLRWCAPTFLPRLRSIRGHPTDLPILVASRPLQVSQLVAVEPTALPNLLPWVQQLFVHEDKTWGERRSPALDFGEHVRKMVNCLSHISTLRDLIVVTTYDAEQAHVIRRTIFECCTAPRLGTVIIRLWNQLQERDELFTWPRVFESAEFLVEYPLKSWEL
ncbi:hypothetical protein B0H14DRAFT_2589970 [Mycena olivaceomarginata]|nr:hypothetical protein B0H14DRAFT_2589970 [Mycena olivaceomarginata]